jgi:hypothetical protein
MCTTLLVHCGGIVDYQTDRQGYVRFTLLPLVRSDRSEIVSGLLLTLPDDLLALCRD